MFHRIDLLRRRSDFLQLIHIETDEMARSDMSDAKIPQYVDGVVGVEEGTL